MPGAPVPHLRERNSELTRLSELAGPLWQIHATVSYDTATYNCRGL